MRARWYIFFLIHTSNGEKFEGRALHRFKHPPTPSQLRHVEIEASKHFGAEGVIITGYQPIV